MFTLTEITAIRSMRRNGIPVGEIQRRLAMPRDHVNEGYWATLRCEQDAAAREHANRCILCRERGMPLINGKPQAWVAKNWPEARFL